VVNQREARLDRNRGRRRGVNYRKGRRFASRSPVLRGLKDFWNKRLPCQGEKRAVWAWGEKTVSNRRARIRVNRREGGPKKAKGSWGRQGKRSDAQKRGKGGGGGKSGGPERRGRKLEVSQLPGQRGNFGTKGLFVHTVNRGRERQTSRGCVIQTLRWGMATCMGW